MADKKQNYGEIVSVIGVVVDAYFPGKLPEIYNALEYKFDNGEKLVLEVQQHIGNDRVRTVAMGGTDGIARGSKVLDTGAPISVPVGEEVLGRMFDVTGNTIDEGGELEVKERAPIHRKAPSFSEQAKESEILETGIKVIDLLCPFLKGGKVGLFGGAGVGK
ncbi:MAG: F0F1 ATP synthase subunit beta, partial [Candidatus Dojkabacteria bacterium]